MREEFEKLAASGKISRQHIEPLMELAQGGYCMHRSWGFGKITTVDTVFSRFSIDFEGKAGHSMDLGFAVTSLQPIPKDHILARKYADINGLRQMAALQHLDLIKLVLQSFGGKATLAQIQESLVPEVIEADWKKWWEVAKKELKKDGHFKVPIKKTEPIEYNETVISLEDRLMGEFKAAKGLKAKIGVVNELIKSIEDISNRQETVHQIVETLNKEIESHRNTKQALAMEAIFTRDDLLEASGMETPEGSIKDRELWAQNLRLDAILGEVPAAKHKKTLQSYQQAFPETWTRGVLDIINYIPAKLCSECASLLIAENHLNELKEVLVRLINQHQAGSELLLWLSKERSDAYADILGPEVFRAMLTAIERDQFNEKKSNRLGDFIIDDKDLLVDLIGSADIEVIKDLTRALKLSGSFDDMDKRSLLARIVKSYPSIQALISGEQQVRQEQDQGLIVSWESLARRKNEYEKLVRKKIPANSKEIAIARSYGDLRENHEYKSAKEMQKLLMKRKAELEQDLGKARGTDFANVTTDAVGIGTEVEVTELGSEHKETLRIMGAWDSDPENGIISYQTPLAQALMSHKAGEEIDFDLGTEKKRYRIDSIGVAEVKQPDPTPDSSGASAASSNASVPEESPQEIHS